jgi:hypothetical protein
MTLALLNDLDIQTSFVGNKITVIPRQQRTKVMTVEMIELHIIFSLVELLVHQLPTVIKT